MSNLRDQFKILVADDDPDITDLISTVLAEDNHNVLVVYDGASAIETARRERPDLIILDVNMPKPDGYEVIHKLRADVATRETPIILLTANGDERSALKGFARGADDFLVKPFTPSNLRARVTTWLLRRGSQGTGS